MGDVVKLDRKAVEERRKAASKAAGADTAQAGSRPVWAVIGGLVLVLMIVVTLML